MIWGLSGYSGTGKDTASTYLVNRHGFVRASFADKLRDFCYEVNPKVTTISGTRRLKDYVDAVGWDNAKRESMEVREFLQSVGHGARVAFGSEFWIDRALTPEVLKNTNIVISDVRYQNEVDRISDLGGFIIRVQREGIGPVNDHITEHPLPFDYTLNNPEKYLQGLYSNIDTLVHNLVQLRK